MLLVLALTFSILCITFSYLKKISKRKPLNTRTNPELNKFYNLPSNSSPQILYKQLVYAASDFLNFYEDLLKQIDFIEPLYKDRLISDDYYNNLVV
jgi:hypothetical protein